jgi:glucokinase-like ROK family protein
MVEDALRRPIPGEALDSLAVVIDLVRRRRAQSRNAIAEATGLSPSVVAQRVSELISRGLLVEKEGPSTGGRPPKRLEFAADSGYLLVAYLGLSHLEVAVSNLVGDISARGQEPLDLTAGPEPVMTKIKDLLEGTERSAHPAGVLWGIGIGIAHPIQFDTGRPVAPPVKEGWDGYPIAETFAQRYGVPVWVDNDVNVMALGEWRAGVAQGHANVIFVKVGTGIGAGIVADGRIHRGSQGCAGEIGHIRTPGDRSTVCRCGQVDCLDAVAGGAAIARAATALANSGESPILAALLESRGAVAAEDVAAAAASGDPACIELLQRSARMVGEVIANLVNFFNPSMIVIGGRVATSGDQFLATIRETVYGRSVPLATRDLQIVRSIGEDTGVRGSAAMVLDELFSRRHLASWIDSGRPNHFLPRPLGG